MVAVNPVISLKASPSFSTNNNTASAYVAPAAVGDTLEISKQIPKKSGFLRNMAKVLMLGTALGTGAVAMSCSNGVTPSPGNEVPPPTNQPTKPPTNPALENTALTKSLNNLNPIIQDSKGEKISGASVSDLSLDSIDSWSYDDSTGSRQVTTVKSIDSTTGAIKVTVADFDDQDYPVGAARDADLIKMDDNTVRIKVDAANYTDMAAIDNGTRKSTTYKSLPSEQVDLKPITQGLDAKYNVGTTNKVGEWENVMVKLKITAKALSEQKALRALIK